MLHRGQHHYWCWRQGVIPIYIYIIDGIDKSKSRVLMEQTRFALVLLAQTRGYLFCWWHSHEVTSPTDGTDKKLPLFLMAQITGYLSFWRLRRKVTFTFWCHWQEVTSRYDGTDKTLPVLLMAQTKEFISYWWHRWKLPFLLIAQTNESPSHGTVKNNCDKIVHISNFWSRCTVFRRITLHNVYLSSTTKFLSFWTMTVCLSPLHWQYSGSIFLI